MMVNLQRLGSNDVIVDFPDEPTTGADMEWNFINLTIDTFYRLLLQAKCAYGNDPPLSRHTYKYLSHRVGGKYQAEIICASARQSNVPTYPMYIFYNPEHSCSLARGSDGPMIEGVNLADGYSIRGFATMGSRHIPDIRKHMHGLTALFCPSDDPARIPRPADVRAYLMRELSGWFRLPAEIVQDLDAHDHMMIPPEVGASIPEDVRARL
jgi:hypothetical protein